MKTLMILLIAGFGLCSLKSDKVSSRDKKFAEEAMLASLREIKFGKLAQSNSSLASVKALGKKMVTDHSRANTQLKALASKKGIALPKSMTTSDEKKYNELSKLKGNAFDKEFADCSLKYHKDVFELYRQQAMKGDDDELVTFASNNGFSIEHHVTKSEAICKEVKKNK